LLKWALDNHGDMLPAVSANANLKLGHAALQHAVKQKSANDLVTQICRRCRGTRPTEDEGRGKVIRDGRA
jgi:hypothetical protein